MTTSPPEKLVIAISSRALFDLDEAHRVFEREGLEAYSRYQVDNENVPLGRGTAFTVVNKLLSLNERLPETMRVEVVLLSRNSADTGLRVFNSIEHYGLGISRAAFCGGEPPWRYISAFGCHLFLSAEPSDVRKALENHVAAATLLSRNPQESAGSQLRFAFDGDAVLFSDESERVYQEAGLDGFIAHETAAANEPMSGGPFKPFLSALHTLQSEFSEKDCPIRTALVTARSAPTHERVIKTLRSWGIYLNESLFLGGMRKSEFLEAYRADVFFDDQAEHCALAKSVVPTGHVPHGVVNRPG